METSLSSARPKGKKLCGPGRLLFWPAVILMLGAVLVWQQASAAVLVVRDMKTHRVLEIGPISEGDSFELRFIHSVDLLPVRDFFAYRDGGLVLCQTRCLSFGAGLGYTGQGELKSHQGWNVIENMDRRVGALPLRVGAVADHTIIYGGEAYRLNRYFAPKSLVKIGVEQKWRF